MAIPVRLYLVCTKTNRKIKNRTYASIENFNKYGLETYERYNREYYYSGTPTYQKALVSYYEDGKWVQFDEKYMVDLLKGNLCDD